MTVECPYCGARFRVDPDELPRPRPVFKCSRCERIFAPPADAASPVHGRSRERAGSGESLPLPFPDNPEEPLEEPTETEGYHTAAAEETEPDEPARRISVRPLVLVTVLVVAGYGLLVQAMLADPRWASGWIDRIPLLGRPPLSTTLRERVELEISATRWERLRDGTPVLVVTGKARNESPFPLADIQIEVTAVDTGGAKRERRIVFCGHPVPGRLRAFGLQQLLILVSVKPSRKYAVDPGEACPFTAILPHSRPAGIAAVEARVAAALRRSPRS